MTTLIYPNNLGRSKRPLVHFFAFQKNTRLGSVSLPMPNDYAVFDNAAYSTFDMGAISQSVVNGAIDAAKSLNDAGSIRSKLEAGVDVISSASAQTRGSVKAALILTEAAKYSTVAQTAAARAGIVKNPNTTTSFQNMGKRQFSFSFQLVPESRQDSGTIKNIHDFFRKNMYPEKIAGGYLLKYPATFLIAFTGTEYYPRIAECYLSSMQVSFNSSGGLPMSDGAPNDATITLNFEETRVLTQEDIQSLNDGVYPRGSYLPLEDIENVDFSGIVNFGSNAVSNVVQRTVRN